MTLISKELSEQIEREAEAYDEYGSSLTASQGYITGATHWAERCQQMAEALERVKAMTRVDPVAFKFPGYTEQESKAAAVGYNQALEDTWAIIDLYASKALASWKEEGKDTPGKAGRICCDCGTFVTSGACPECCPMG